MSIVKLISGGQTGADRGGLDAAIEYGIPHGGWCPKGRIAEDDTIPLKYDLKEMTNKDYLKRTEANVVDSDATVIFTVGKLSGGSKRTVDFCQKHGKLWKHFDFDEIRPPFDGVIKSTPFEEIAKPVVSWLLDTAIPDELILNVAGSRESKCQGIQHLVFGTMREVLNATNGFHLHSLCDEG